MIEMEAERRLGTSENILRSVFTKASFHGSRQGRGMGILSTGSVSAGRDFDQCRLSLRRLEEVSAASGSGHELQKHNVRPSSAELM